MADSERPRRWHALLQPALAMLRGEGVVLFGALGVGLASALATRWFVAFVLLSAAFLYLAWMRALGGSEASRRFRQRARVLGLWTWAFLLALIGLAVFWRFSRWWTALIFGVVYLAVWAWHVVWLSRRGGEPAGQFRQAVALGLLPVLLAWIVNSTVYQAYVGVESRLRQSGEARSAWVTRTAARDRRLAAADATYAVALSGGGYRAAAVHAGVLSVLEEAGLPLEYLSTVSGGSIVGGAYAMGMSAADFRDRLAADKPGLPNDLSNFYTVFAQLFVPGYGSGDTYARHFDRVFFAGRELGGTGPPHLIINATRYVEGTRRAFWAENDADQGLARLVAASGAFPVAFDPVVIDGERYIDGGVVENLGIAGLQQYLTEHADDLPRVLIISDASLIPEAPAGWTKPSPLQMALRAQQTSYFAMHRWIYSFYTDGAFDRAANGGIEQPFETTAGRLWPELPAARHDEIVRVFVLSPSSPAERQRFAGHEALLDRVSALETLRELSRAEVEAAFWVGARLAADYLPQICRAAGIACDTVDPGPAPAF
jgi:predicted acylesterase/phospholipase RssA